MKIKYLVAYATLFDFILFHTVHTLVKVRVRDIHQFFAWGFHCGCILKMTGSLLAEELSCCDFFRVKVSRGCHAMLPMGLEPMSPTSVALTAQYLNVRQRK